MRRPGRYDENGREREFVVVCHCVEGAARNGGPTQAHEAPFYLAHCYADQVCLGQRVRKGQWMLTQNDIDTYVFSYAIGDADAFRRAKTATRSAIVRRLCNQGQAEGDGIWRVAIHAVSPKRERTVCFWHQVLAAEVWPRPSDPIASIATLADHLPALPW